MQRWSGAINIRCGMLDDIFRMLQTTGSTQSDFEKVCVISFDEMKVKETIEFDEKDQEFVGPHKQMQVRCY